MLLTICENDFKPAVDYLDVVLGKLNNHIPIIPYVISVHYEESPKLESKAQDILNKYPMIAQLKDAALFGSTKDAKFEKALKNKTITAENKKFFVEDMLMKIDVKQFDVKLEDKITISPEILQQMTDITVLELLKTGKFEEANYVMKKDRLVPSMEVIETLVQNLRDTGNLDFFP